MKHEKFYYIVLILDKNYLKSIESSERNLALTRYT